jgi:antitoxin MazE
MKARVQRWGNSLALRIPKPFAEQAKLRESSVIEMKVIDGTIVVTPVEMPVTLQELLDGITDENLHAPVETGAPLGNEAL